MVLSSYYDQDQLFSVNSRPNSAVQWVGNSTAGYHMATYHLHRGWLVPNGLVTNHVEADRAIEATCPGDALTAALADGSFLAAVDANLVWLIDGAGKLVWSLSLSDGNIELEP